MTDIALPGYYVPAPALAKLQEARTQARWSPGHRVGAGGWDSAGLAGLFEAVDDLLEAAKRADQLTPIIRRLMAAEEAPGD